jgi:hypothetical protein
VFHPGDTGDTRAIFAKNDRKWREIGRETGGRGHLLQPMASGSAPDYSLASCAVTGWKTPAPDTCEAIKKAATTAGTLISLRN